MPTIKPISDLRNKTSEISDLVHASHEPVFITKNGEGDMVLMSLRNYEHLQLKMDLLGKLAVAQASRAAGDNGRTLESAMTEIRKRLHAKT